ncbi:MAG TPA: methionyl-tRNA formyltransferase [Rubrobacteraceae bacterium]|nr:methionyl-tRNA formyltransferase [Rubrobacteraceae bacterium]
MKIAFAGTPDFAATVLRGLISSGHEVGLVVSQPDARKGRGRRAQPTPVAQLARSLDLPLRQPARMSEVAGEISSNDALVVAAYGQILRPDTLYAANEGAWNVHASLLPKYRGAAPIERSIMAGEPESGVTIIRMDEGLDTGPMALQRPLPIPPDMTGGELSELLACLGAEAVVEVLNQIESGTVNLIEQDSLHATYAPKLLDEDLEIRWDRSVEDVANLVRALSPHVGARAFNSGVEGPVKIWRAEVFDGEVPTLKAGAIRTENGRILVGCGVGVLEVLELQMPGGKRLAARDFLRGNTLEGAFDR